MRLSISDSRVHNRAIQCINRIPEFSSLVSRPHPPGEEKDLVTIRHPARSSDVSRLVYEMTNHGTVRVISSAVWSHVVS